MNARLVAVIAVALALVVVPVTAHTNHVSVDAQVSADGTVIVEGALVATDGFLVVHADDESISDVLGHTAISSDSGFVTDIRVRIAAERWAGWGARHVWVAFHRDDGDGQFEPGQDPIQESFGTPVASRIIVENGSTAYVTAEDFSPEETRTPTVHVRAATLPDDGHLVLRNGSADGRVVGHTSLPAGTARNVSVELDRSFFAAHERFTLAAVLYTDDGDGSFDEDDTPVRAGDSVVATTFRVKRTGNVTSTPTGTLFRHVA